jgi:hypothetical protein
MNLQVCLLESFHMRQVKYVCFCKGYAVGTRFSPVFEVEVSHLPDVSNNLQSHVMKRRFKTLHILLPGPMVSMQPMVEQPDISSATKAPCHSYSRSGVCPNTRVDGLHE